MISLKELQSYANLKDISLMDEKDFITFATTVINLKQNYGEDYLGPAGKFGISEMKYTLARLGYNPLVNSVDIGMTVIEKYKNNPATKELAEKMGK